jgi:putative addiction module component (TIGR02574 family)
MSTKEILEAALKLDPIERARLADTIWRSISEADIEAIEDAEDTADAEAILARMKENREAPIPWEDVKKRLGLGTRACRPEDRRAR